MPSQCLSDFVISGSFLISTNFYSTFGNSAIPLVRHYWLKAWTWSWLRAVVWWEIVLGNGSVCRKEKKAKEYSFSPGSSDVGDHLQWGNHSGIMVHDHQGYHPSFYGLGLFLASRGPGNRVSWCDVILLLLQSKQPRKDGVLQEDTGRISCCTLYDYILSYHSLMEEEEFACCAALVRPLVLVRGLDGAWPVAGLD